MAFNMHKIRMILILLMCGIGSLLASEGKNDANISGKNLPKFMTIKTVPANLRTGPNTKYPISWVYIKTNEPVKIIDKFEQWYMISDINNNQGWLHARLLNKEKNAIIQCKDQIIMYKDDSLKSKALAYIKNNVRVSVNKCSKKWCLIKKDDHAGWVEKRFLWGIE